MSTADTPFVKICCISSSEEAELAIANGASALGLVSKMPSGPGVISEDLIASIARTVAGRAETVLLTSLTEPHAISLQINRCGVTGVQLCEWLSEDARRTLRKLIPDVMMMQVAHVVDSSAIGRALSAQRFVDRILLDSGTLSGPVRELGGTGRTHDWSVSRTIVDRVEVPVLLAGGLHAGNAAEALENVRPYGLDVCSGVRSDGRLDPDRLAAFFRAVNGGAE